FILYTPWVQRHERNSHLPYQYSRSSLVVHHRLSIQSIHCNTCRLLVIVKNGRWEWTEIGHVACSERKEEGDSFEQGLPSSHRCSSLQHNLSGLSPEFHERIERPAAVGPCNKQAQQKGSSGMLSSKTRLYRVAYSKA
ncbi:unnamed protein product, partial [Choristocarpus tenellus]